MTGPSSSVRILGESWRAWIALFVGVLVITGHTASSYALAVLMKPILAEFDWLRTEFAFARFLRIGAMVVALAYVGKLTDRLGARFVFSAGAVLIGAGTLATAAMDSLPQFLVIMTLMGPGQACVGSVAASALVLRQFRRRRGLAIGVLNGGDNLLSSALPIAVTAVAGLYGWRSAVGLLGCSYFALVVVVRWALRPSEGSDRDESAEPGTAARRLPWRDSRLWLLCGTYFLIYAFITSLLLHLHAFLTDLGHSREQASQVFSTLILVGAIGAPLFGWLCERTSARLTLLILVAGLALNSLVLWSPPSHEMLLVWAVSYGLVNSGAVAVLALALAEMFGAAQIGRLMGVAMSFCMLATMFADVYTAAMFDWLGSYVPVWRGYTALMIFALLPAGLLLRAPTGSRSAGAA